MRRTKIMACINQKGGTGKSTTCENLGIGLANEGKKVLLVDMDPQASLTIVLGWQRPDELDTTISDLMIRTIREEPISENEGILHHKEGVNLIPANISLAGLEVSLVNVMSRESVLREYLSGIKNSSTAASEAANSTDIAFQNPITKRKYHLYLPEIGSPTVKNAVL